MNSFAPDWPLSRLIHSDTAIAKKIDNTPPDILLENLSYLSRTLQKISDALKVKFPKARIWIESGYRCPKLNVIIGGSATSNHVNGLAADIKVSGISVMELALFIKETIDDYDQIIYEFGRWVHLGLIANGKPRKQTLTARKDSNKKTFYIQGLRL